MAEVERGQVEQVDDEEQFANPEPTTNPEHDEAEDQEVVLTFTSVRGLNWH